MTVSLENWLPPRPIDHSVGIRRTWTRQEFKDFYWTEDARTWFMTEAQRETWLQEIMADWDTIKWIVRQDRTDRHLKQLVDMDELGGGMLVINSEYGTGKSILANIHLKMWQLLKLNSEKRFFIPSIYWRRKNARDYIKAAPNHSAHSIDEDQRGSGSGSQAVIKHLLNMFETVRKTGKLVMQLGINVEMGRLGRAVALEIRPFGFNRNTQTNRFIAYSNREKPMWLGALQRIYLPHERVYYINQLGTFAEYDARAAAFSSSSDGIYSERDELNELAIRDDLVKVWKDKFDGITPNLSALSFEARQFFTPQVEKQLEDIVGSAAIIIKQRMKSDGSSSGTPRVNITSKGWDILRDELLPLSDSETLAYLIPSIPRESLPDVVERIKPVSEITGEEIRPDSYGKRIRERRRLLQKKTRLLGDAGERAFASWLDSLNPTWGGGGDETNDVTIPMIPDDDPRGPYPEIAVNVKLTLKDSYKDQVETTPEDSHPNGIVALLIPRALEIRLFHISGPKTSLNSSKGILSNVGSLATKVQEMIIDD